VGNKFRARDLRGILFSIRRPCDTGKYRVMGGGRRRFFDEIQPADVCLSDEKTKIRHGDVSYSPDPVSATKSSQLLTGHGDFNAKLKSFRMVGEHCGLGDETVEHVLFEGVTHEDERDRLRGTVRVADDY